MATRLERRLQRHRLGLRDAARVTLALQRWAPGRSFARSQESMEREMTARSASKPKRRAFAAAAFLALLFAPPALAGEVRVTIANATTEGDIVVSLCTESQYPRWRDCATQRRAAENETPSRFANVSPGRYAVIAYQDQNRNGRLDLQMFGPPLEPHGASNDPRPRIGPPRFGDMAFSVDEGPRDVAIVLRTR